MTPRNGSELLAARTTFVVGVGGRTILVSAGDLAAPDHPVVLASPKNWGPLRIKFASPETGPVETGSPPPVAAGPARVRGRFVAARSGG